MTENTLTVFEAFVKHITNPINIFSPEQYVTRNFNEVIQRKEVFGTWRYLAGGGYLEAHMENTRIRIFFNIYQGFQIFIRKEGKKERDQLPRAWTQHCGAEVLQFLETVIDADGS